jgi:hypothetical protein
VLGYYYRGARGARLSACSHGAEEFLRVLEEEEDGGQGCSRHFDLREVPSRVRRLSGDRRFSHRSRLSSRKAKCLL